jgi:hypothetical protein
MTDHSGGSRGRPLETMTDAEDNRVIAVPIEDIVFDENAADEDLVRALMESIGSSIQINPILVTARNREDETKEYLVHGGVSRVVALKRLRKPTIQCTLLASEDRLLLEQVSIDENLIRRNLGPAETAMLWGRRTQVKKKISERDGTLSQDATASKQAKRAAGLETGHDVGSVRDQAQQTGESKDKIHRSMKRFETLGRAVLESVVGTSLDSGVELDALGELSEGVRGDLIKGAAAGGNVSAKKALRAAQRAAQPAQSPVLDVEHAKQDFIAWRYKYRDLWAEKDWKDKIDYLELLLDDIFADRFEIPDLEEEDSESAEKGGWFGPLWGRKDD